MAFVNLKVCCPQHFAELSYYEVPVNTQNLTYSNYLFNLLAKRYVIFKEDSQYHIVLHCLFYFTVIIHLHKHMSQ